MTNKQLPGPRDGASERRSWPVQRPMFDAAVAKSEFFKSFTGLVEGRAEAADVIRIVSDMNSTTNMAGYSTEAVGMRKAFRSLTDAGYNERVAQFLREASLLIPSLKDGLAGEMISALWYAAQNDAYLATVGSALENIQPAGLSREKLAGLTRVSALVEERRKAKSPALDEASSASPLSSIGSDPIEAPPSPDSSARDPSTPDSTEPEQHPEDGAVQPSMKPPRRFSLGKPLAALVAVAGIIVLGFAFIRHHKSHKIHIEASAPVESRAQKPEVREPKPGLPRPAQAQTAQAQPAQAQIPAQRPAASETAISKTPLLETRQEKESGAYPVAALARKPAGPTSEEVLARLREPSEADWVDERAMEIARAIVVMPPEEARRVFAGINPIVPSGFDAGLDGSVEAGSEDGKEDGGTSHTAKRTLVVPVLRRVALGRDPHKAVNAIARLGALAEAGDSEAARVLDGLSEEKKVRGSIPRTDALRKALPIYIDTLQNHDLQNQ